MKWRQGPLVRSLSSKGGWIEGREVWPGDVTVRREPVSCDGGALIENLLEEMTILDYLHAQQKSVITYVLSCGNLNHMRTRVDRVKMYLRVNPHQVHILDGNNWS